jgi:hypothetical protein
MKMNPMGRQLLAMTAMLSLVTFPTKVGATRTV